MTKAQQTRQTKYDQQPKTHCPFCSAPLKEELGVKKCENLNCTYKETKKVEQVKLIK